MKRFLSNLAIALVCTTVAFFLFRTFTPTPTIVMAPEPEPTAPVQLVNNETFVNQNPRSWANNAPTDFVETSSEVTKSVVNITTMGSGGYRISSGSGVIISSDGYIITNHHVIENGVEFDVTLYNKRNLTATLVGIDPTTDLALLKLKAGKLRPLRYGDSDRVKVGQWVLAVGNPFNLTSTVTAGIVSAKARNINILRSSYAIESFIQTDAVVNPGNSGGALVNTKGELIGINTAIISESGGYEGYSFAIPANLVRKVIDDLKDFGRVQRAILGIGIEEITDEYAAKLSLPKVAGVLVLNVNEGSSADEAGLKKGDVIIRVNEIATNSIPELQEQVALFRPGDYISIEFFRNGKRYLLEDVKLKSLGNDGSFRQ